MAPEVLSSAIYSPACDMWAVGVILYFCLQGLPPFAARDQATILQRIRRCDWDRCAGPMWNGVSEDAKELICGLLEPEYQLRLSSRDILSHPLIRTHDEPNPEQIGSPEQWNWRQLSFKMRQGKDTQHVDAQ